ncbi:MAG: pilus assembly protein PilM [Ruminococcus sp.]
MAKSCLGIDIGKDQMKLVLMKGENIVKTASVQMPEGLLKDGRIVSVETTGELIRKTMKENKIRCKEAAVVVSSRNLLSSKCDDAGNDCGAAGL